MKRRSTFSEDRWGVAHVITHLDLGGAQRATLAQVAQTGIRFHHRALLASPQGLLSDEARSLDGVDFFPLSRMQRAIDPRKDIPALLELTRALRRLRQQSARLLVHTHSPKAGILGRLASRLVGVDRVVHSFHGFAHGRGRLGKALLLAERSCAPLAHGYTTDSFSNREQGLAEGLFAGRPVRVVHCGVDLDAFRFSQDARARVRNELGFSDEQFLVVTLANLKAQKDPLTFVKVAARVAKKDPRVRFIYAGDGPLRGDVEHAIAEHGVAEQVRLLGWRTDASALLSASDLFLLTSLWEGLPQSFGQAMARGLPIVATRVDGAVEAVDDGKTGFLAEPRDVESISNAVLTCARDAKLCERLGSAGMKHAERFSKRQMLDTLDRFYRDLLA